MTEKDFTGYKWNIEGDGITFYRPDGETEITVTVNRLRKHKNEIWLQTEHFQEGNLLVKIDPMKIADAFGK